MKTSGDFLFLVAIDIFSVIMERDGERRDDNE